MARLWRYLFNRSNLFVGFLIFFTAVNTYLSTNTGIVLQSQNKSAVRVEEITKDNFNITKIAISDSNGYWLIDNYKGDKINLGFEILADVTYSKFKKDDKHNNYFLSKGFKGNASLITVYGVRNCDLSCKYINLIANTKRIISDIFLQSACNSERWITNFFAKALSCHDDR
jgi:hypothetical protein